MLLDYLFRFMEAVIVIRVIISWFPVPRNNKFVELLFRVTEPVLLRIRDLLSRTPLGQNMMFDFSPIVVFLAIEILRYISRILLLK